MLLIGKFATNAHCLLKRGQTERHRWRMTPACDHHATLPYRTFGPVRGMATDVRTSTGSTTDRKAKTRRLRNSHVRSDALGPIPRWSALTGGVPGISSACGALNPPGALVGRPLRPERASSRRLSSSHLLPLTRPDAMAAPAEPADFSVVPRRIGRESRHP
jgi:hypothetical protein